jgi:sulfite exporter TauE/SafE
MVQLAPSLAAIDSATGLVAFFALGLVGSVHCLGMCGPLVTTYADRLEATGGSQRRTRRQLALFNVGRTASYTLIGGLLGALGATAFELASLLALGGPVRGIVGIGVGLVVLAAGTSYLTRGHSISLGERLPVVGRLSRRVTGALTARIDALVDGPGVLALGALHGLLPCPLLYPAFLAAFATGSARTGALSLFALGVGTIPLVFSAGIAVGTLSTRQRVRLHRLLGVVFLVLGLVPLANGLAEFGLTIPKPPLPMP